jgi:hypothetical protein
MEGAGKLLCSSDRYLQRRTAQQTSEQFCYGTAGSGAASTGTGIGIGMQAWSVSNWKGLLCSLLGLVS